MTKQLTEWPRLDDMLGVVPFDVPRLSEVAYVVPCSQCGELLVGPRRSEVPTEDTPLMEQLVCIQCTYGVEHISPELLEMVTGHATSEVEMSLEKYQQAKEIMVGGGAMTEHDFYILIAKLISAGIEVEVEDDDKIDLMKIMVELMEQLRDKQQEKDSEAE